MFKKLILLFVFVLMVLAAGIVYVSQQPMSIPAGQSSIHIDIKQGQTLSELAYLWQKQGWLPSARLLLLQAKILSSAKNIKPGEFEVPENTNSMQLLSLLTQGSNKRYRVSFIEGTRLSVVLANLANAPKLVQDVQPLTVAKVQALLQLDVMPEGLVYPDTYVYQSGDSVSSILKQSYQRMQQVLAQEWQEYESRGGEKLPYRSAYEALIMASIVEKETGQAIERPEIAGVFVRRLQKNMRLETDPTVIYGLGDTFDGNLRKKHLRDRSNPYNSYRNKGLPPTPIALAGREAINAALNPDSGKSLYFVAKGDGSHYFSSSLAEHNRAVRKYQIFRRSKDYRSAPATN
ncbi:MAG: endolytic transglycosylase MltG [Oleispira sp.]|nr:endolytic transglycosylase MltG [Oleispira sp.]